MKKFFTLIAAAMLSTGAFAQTEWKNLVVNGNMEGAADPMWSSFWCHDWRQGVEFDEASGQSYADPSPNATVENPPCMFMGFAEIVEDPADPSNHCARVVIRTKEEADATGTATTDDANNKPDWVEWDSQFFVYATETIPEGKEIRLTLRVKGEKAGTFQTQAHYTPGDYNHYQLFGDVNYTTEWQKITLKATVSSSHTQESNGKFFQSVAFNLSTMQDGNTVYFDDVKLEMRDKPEVQPGQWFNMLRHGTESKDKVGNYTNFTGRNGIDNTDRVAEVVTAEDGKPALKVSSVGYNAEYKKPQLDENGDPILDDEGNPAFDVQPIYITQDGDTLRLQNSTSFGIDDWRTQFFITTPHEFQPNSTFHLKMQYRADVPTSVATQIHTTPGAYVHWDAIGTLNFTEEWQEIDQDFTMPSQASAGGCRTIAFNCNALKEQDNNLYFRFDEFSFSDTEVTEDERTLDNEAVRIPVPEPANSDGTQKTIDLTNCMTILEASSIENLVNEKMSVVSGEDTENDVEIFSIVDPSAGFYMADNGWLGNEQDKISFEFEEVKDGENELTATVFNEGDSFAGKTINTKFRFEFNKWFYLFNVALVSEEEYNGISDVQMKQQPNGIYDLMGRRLVKPTKGLYIMNGKKYIAK